MLPPTVLGFYLLAVLGRVAEDAIRLAGIDNLAGKTVIDGECLMMPPVRAKDAGGTA